MSDATLNVWITAFGDPCHIIDVDEWFVHVVDCEGKVVKWCGKIFRDIPTKCGHAEVRLPPGCYAVFASHSKASATHPFGNRLTHVQVVRVNCGDHACVTLFSPTMWFCGTWFKAAVEQHIELLATAKVDQKIARAAIDAVGNLLAKIPADPFSANLEEFQQRPK